MNIQFTDFSITPFKIQCVCTKLENDTLVFNESLYFDFSTPVTISQNYVAIALSTLCIRAYTEIYFDLEIASNILSLMKEYCCANISCRSITAPYHREITTDTILFNFSGGFDSLSALQLMPKNIALISLDFGKRFEREVNYFSTFSPYTVTTNARELRLTDASWSFMGMGSILYCETLHAKYISFGTIFEASPWNLLKTDIACTLSTFPAFACAELINAPFIVSMTEVATAAILACCCPDYIPDSLTSLSAPGSVKLYRKQLLATHALKQHNTPCQLPTFTLPKKPLSFGKYFGDDFLCPYLLKQFGQEAIAPLMTDIPEEIVSCANTLSLTLYERYHPAFITALPNSMKHTLLEGLKNAGILPYESTDFEEFEVLRKIFSHYYSI